MEKGHLQDWSNGAPKRAFGAAIAKVTASLSDALSLVPLISFSSIAADVRQGVRGDGGTEGQHRGSNDAEASRRRRAQERLGENGRDCRHSDDADETSGVLRV